MPDEPTAPAEEQDKPTPEAEAPAPAGQAETPAEESFSDFSMSQVPEDADRNWFEEKYNDLRSGWTRKVTELAQQRQQVQAVIEAAQNPEHPQHAEALEYLGFEAFEDDLDEDEADDDPLSPIEQRLAAVEQAEQQRAEALQAQQVEAQLEDFLESEISDLQRSEGIDEFSEAELRLLVNAAVASPDSEGKPDVKGAYEALKEALSTRQKAWLSSKSAPRAPGAGVPASAELDVTDRQKRIDEATRIAEAAMGG